MQLELPDEVINRIGASSDGLRMALAIQLYCDNRISHDDACLLSGVVPAWFNRELLQRGLNIQQFTPASYNVARAAG